jgi:VIT1/CCC1 family predicted Fe2+/Mn2+ transporter
MSLVDRTRSLSNLLGNSVEQLGELVQNEIQLAQAELSEKVAAAGRGVTWLAATAVFLIPVITLLLVAFALWLKEVGGISFALSFLIAALLGAVLGLICAYAGLNYLRLGNLKPAVTLEQIKRDIAAAKEIAK